MREIVIYPDPVLRKKAREVKSIDDRVARLAAEMAETMYAAPGIGLAAPQVGVSERVILVDVTGPERKELITLVNPVIVEKEGTVIFEEGCLSLPEVREKVERAARVLVRGYDLDEREREIEAEGLLAIALQHEIDHLNGVLFIDYLSRLKRDMIERKLRKWKREILKERL
ncbi:MAG: peptide deformylase [Deltaproteobacteria bacterium]|nr:MAG: peptide deformylase [Deltaproteobacteria bacterium]